MRTKKEVAWAPKNQSFVNPKYFFHINKIKHPMMFFYGTPIRIIIDFVVKVGPVA